MRFSKILLLAVATLSLSSTQLLPSLDSLRDEDILDYSNKGMTALFEIANLTNHLPPFYSPILANNRVYSQDLAA